MAHFLLIHGSGHGAWCWRDVIPALTRLGHSATAIDLPSHGADDTPVEQVTLADYADTIQAALTQPSYVVGHSMGGYPITLAAEQDNRLIKGLIYLCAYTPWPDMTLGQMRLQAPYQPLAQAIIPSADRKSWRFDTAQAERLLYHDCPQVLPYALANLTAQAVAPTQTTIALSPRSQDLPRAYIRCLQDGTIPPEFQTEMAARFAPEDVFDMNTSHSPFFSAPDALAGIFDRFATRKDKT